MNRKAENQFPVVWAACGVAGLLGLALGFVLPAISSGPNQEERSQAAEFLEATRAMESAAATRSSEERTKKMAEARKKYRQAREQALETRSSKGRAEFWLKVGGGALAAIGCGGAYLRGAA